MNTSSKTPLDVILISGLTVFLLVVGIALFRRGGAARVVGGILLLILLADVLGASSLYTQYLTNATKFISTANQSLSNAKSNIGVSQSVKSA